MKRINPDFKPEIEGIRAIAIILVVAAHVNISGMEGGFIGVDIFFVLSGFLITGLLLKETEEKGRIDLVSFYARRLKRLLPALIFMVVTIGAVSAVLLAPFEHDNQAISAIYAVTWTSNMYFALANFGYFDSGAESNLFLHTWSLGVEEQFYIVWPALILVLTRLFKSGEANSKSQGVEKGFLMILIVGLFASLLLFAFRPVWSFYFMPSRAWQFSAGALACLYVSTGKLNKNRSDLNSRICKFGSLVGLLFIGLATFTFDNESPYPGYRALLPTVGTALLLVCSSGDYNQHLSSRFLSRSVMQWLGKISYSWYLWHWPVLVLGSTLTGNHEPQFLIPLACLSLACAAFSYYLIESPLRYSSWIAQRDLTTIALSIFMIAVLATTGSVWISRSEVWSRQPEQKEFKQTQLDVSRIYADHCDQWYFSADVRPCAYGNPDAANTAVLLGDSVGAQWFPALYELFGGGDWNLILLTKGSCPIIDETFFYSQLNRNFIECDVWRNAAIDWIVQQSPEILFIGNSQVEFTQNQWIDGTKRVLDRVATEIPKVFIIRPTYALPFHGPACIARNKWQSKIIKPLINCSVPAGSERSGRVLDWLQTAVSEYSSASIIDMNSRVCPGGVCSAIVDGKPVFRDEQHITASFARSLHGYFAEYAF
ncbi:MAG: acyltransferase family protein [Gammaproteobacteria bacterium]